MNKQERIEKRMRVATGIINNAKDYNDGVEKIDDYCANHEVGCARRGERCNDCPMTKGKEKLAEMFGFEPNKYVPIVIKADKITVKVGKVTINWIERK